MVEQRLSKAILAKAVNGPELPDLLIARAASLVNGTARRVSAHMVQIDGIIGHRKAIDARLRELVGAEPVDILIVPTNFKPKLFLADMDSTMIGQECIDELADYVGMKAQVATISERAMNGEIAFEPALRERVTLLKGLPVTIIDEIIKTRITLTPGARELVEALRGMGAYTCLVSGGFTLFTGPVSQMIGFDEHRSNILDTENGYLTGTVQEPILGREAKRSTLLLLRDRFNLAHEEVIAIGDGANDLAMMEEAGFGIAYHAKPSVAEAADIRISHTDLSSLTLLLTPC